MHGLALLAISLPLAAGNDQPGGTLDHVPGRNAESSVIAPPATNAPVGMSNVRRPTTGSPIAAPNAVPDASGSTLPSGNQIIERFLSVSGGRSALNRAGAVTTTGTVDGPMGVIHSSTTSDGQGRFRISRRHAGLGTHTVGFDGSIGWLETDDGACRLLSPSEINDHADSVNPVAIIRAFPSRYSNFRTVGRERFDGASCFRVRMNDAFGESLEGWFDDDTGRVRALRLGSDDDSTVIRFDNWTSFNDLVVFTEITIDQNGRRQQVSYDRISLAPVGARSFVVPEAAARLARNAGNPAENPINRPVLRGRTVIVDPNRSNR